MTNFRIYLREVGVLENQFCLLLTQLKQEIEKERNSNKIKKRDVPSNLIATGLSDSLSGDISHDKVTKYLNFANLGSKELWEYNKLGIRKHQSDKGGILILDDSIEEKPLH